MNHTKYLHYALCAGLLFGVTKQILPNKQQDVPVFVKVTVGAVLGVAAIVGGLWIYAGDVYPTDEHRCRLKARGIRVWGEDQDSIKEDLIKMCQEDECRESSVCREFRASCRGYF